MTAPSDTSLYRFGFVIEQTLGHATHYKNLRAAVETDRTVSATWYPLTYAPLGTLETLPLLRSNWSARASLRARRALTRDAASDRYDALYFHTQVATLLSVGLMRRVPTVISLDATPLNYDAVGAAYGHHKSAGAIEKLKSAANMRALHAACAFITFCDWARQSLVQDYGVDATCITVIPPGVNLDLWPRPEPRSTAGPVRILFVGGDFARKGGDILLRAFGTGLREHCELHLVTKTPVEPAPGVHVYHDVAPYSDLLKNLYATADLFVLPTLADCFPHVLQEAMAAGLPVITTEVGAVGEAVRDGETGLLVPPGDVSALAAALDALVSDVPRRQRMGARARVLAELNYDSAANARRVLEIMTQLVSRKNKTAMPAESSAPHQAQGTLEYEHPSPPGAPSRAATF